MGGTSASAIANQGVFVARISQDFRLRPSPGTAASTLERLGGKSRSMLLLVIAAQLSAPVPAKVMWFTPHDSPINVLKPNVVASVRYGLVVAPDGKIQDCRIERSSGNPKLDSHTCRVAKRRAKFRAARGSSGNPMYGVYRTGTNWWIGNGSSPSWPPSSDLEITVSSLPSTIKSPAFIRVKFAVDATGRPSSCIGESKRDDPTLARIACVQLMKSYIAMPATTPAGHRVESIQTALVRFIKN